MSDNPLLKPKGITDPAGKTHAKGGRTKTSISRNGRILTKQSVNLDMDNDELCNFLLAGPNEQAVYVELQHIESDPEEEDRQ